MAELEKNEAKLNENEQYNEIFKEDSSDDEFDPAVQELPEDAEEEEEDADNITPNENELPNDDDSYQSERKPSKHKKQIEEIENVTVTTIDNANETLSRINDTDGSIISFSSNNTDGNNLDKTLEQNEFTFHYVPLYSPRELLSK